MNNNNLTNPSSVLRSFDSTPVGKDKSATLIISALVVLLGLGSGFLLSKNSQGAAPAETQTTQQAVVKTDTEAGVADESSFKDSESPVGILQEGGIEGEGTHNLERPGGKSQTVYLTSTVIDLDSFVGKKVQVWGETLSALKAGWLMDVAKVKVVN